jgi:hypothetical protein
MSEPTCPYHADHENRINRLEDEMKDVKSKQSSPALWVALFGFVGTLVSTLGAFCGVVAVAYFKSKGWM